MKLSAWAKMEGVSYRTALNWFHAGMLPVPARQLPTGTILVDPPDRETSVVVLNDAVRVGDLTEALTSVCARLYGRRSAARRAAAGIAAIEAEPDEAPGDPT